MSIDVSNKDLKGLLDDLKNSLVKDECWKCECFQGFLAQLELDFEEVLPLEELDKLKVIPEVIHCCLGCDPCPPADVYARYLAPDGKGE